MANSKSNEPGFDLILTYLDGFRLSKTLFTACGLGVFDALEMSAPYPAELGDVARRIKVSKDGLKRLLDALTAMNLVQKHVHGESGGEKGPGRGGSGGSASAAAHSPHSPVWDIMTSPQRHYYSNTKVARDYLLDSSPTSCLGYVQHSDRLLYPLWGDLEGAVREGYNRWESVFNASSAHAFSNYYKDPDQLMQFLRGMHSFGTLVSPIVITAFDLSRYTHLVDVGGATGHIAQAACLKYPNMRATVFDLPAVLDAGTPLIFSDGGVSHDRLSTVAGDFFDAHSLPEGDVYVLSRILHDWDDDKALLILQNVYRAMPPGGACLVCDMLLSDDPSRGPLRALLQSLNMLVQTEGRERTQDEFRRLLLAVGFRDVRFSTSGTYLDAILAIKDVIEP